MPQKAKIIPILLILVAMLSFDAGARNGIDAARALASRILPVHGSEITFSIVPSESDSFTYYTDADGRLHIEGNCENSLAMGLGDYLRNRCGITVTWFVRDSVIEPATLPAVEGKVHRDALVRDRFFLNYCTYGYSLNWWKWPEWERFIDWLALNGVNMVLANTGQEAVWQKVWMQFGLSAEQTRAYFTGPSYLAWHRMSNIDNWDGPLPQSWIDAQAELQKQIVDRESELGISPILTSFNGHVPEEIAKLHPEADIRQLDNWGAFDKEYMCWYLNPRDPLFTKVQKIFMQIQKEMYGQNTHIYGVDPFNEVDPPMWDADYLADAARYSYESIAGCDSDAVWLQMGWLFWHKRKNWTGDLVKAYLSPVPKGKLLMLDYYCDWAEIYRRTESFYGQDFIWSYLGNFGGNTVIAGNIEDVSAKITRCLQEGGEGLKGMGCTLEGLDVNSFMYEYVLDRAWQTDRSDAGWFEALADRRLGFRDDNYRSMWETIRTCVLKEAARNKGARVYSRPSLKENGRWNYATIAYDNKDLLKAWEYLCRTQPSNTASYRFDCVNIPRQCIENCFSAQFLQLLDAAQKGDLAGVKKIGRTMKDILKDLDGLLAADSYFLLGKWVEDARSWGTDEEEKDYFEHDARSILSVWGQKGRSLNDYANRGLNGLVRTYHSPRWHRFIDDLTLSVKQGKAFDAEGFEQWSKEFEWNWVDSAQTFQSEPSGDPVKNCRRLYRKYRGSRFTMRIARW